MQMEEVQEDIANGEGSAEEDIENDSDSEGNGGKVESIV